MTHTHTHLFSLSPQEMNADDEGDEVVIDDVATSMFLVLRAFSYTTIGLAHRDNGDKVTLPDEAFMQLTVLRTPHPYCFKVGIACFIQVGRYVRDICMSQ